MKESIFILEKALPSFEGYMAYWSCFLSTWRPLRTIPKMNVFR